jgi:hypothetical protein
MCIINHLKMHERPQKKNKRQACTHTHSLSLYLNGVETIIGFITHGVDCVSLWPGETPLSHSLS